MSARFQSFQFTTVVRRPLIAARDLLLAGASDNQERNAVVMKRVSLRMVTVIVLACVCMVAPAEAQLNTQHIKGTVGLKSGSQAPPGVYFIAPLFYVYKADEVKDRDGQTAWPRRGSHQPGLRRRRQRRHAEETVRRLLRLPGRVSGRRE